MEARHFRFWPEDIPGTIDIPDLNPYQKLESTASRAALRPLRQNSQGNPGRQ
jgi:hypothetical protein